jgi:hypothetical protein
LSCTAFWRGAIDIQLPPFRPWRRWRLITSLARRISSTVGQVTSSSERTHPSSDGYFDKPLSRHDAAFTTGLRRDAPSPSGSGLTIKNHALKGHITVPVDARSV